MKLSSTPPLWPLRGQNARHRHVWNYPNLPFLLGWPGFTLESVAPYRSGSGVSQWIWCSYPDRIATHNRLQALCIDDTHLLRRLDYNSQIFGRLTSCPAMQRSMGLPSRLTGRSCRATRMAAQYPGADRNDIQRYRDRPHRQLNAGGGAARPAPTRPDHVGSISPSVQAISSGIGNRRRRTTCRDSRSREKGRSFHR